MKLRARTTQVLASAYDLSLATGMCCLRSATIRSCSGEIDSKVPASHSSSEEGSTGQHMLWQTSETNFTKSQIYPTPQNNAGESVFAMQE